MLGVRLSAAGALARSDARHVERAVQSCMAEAVAEAIENRTALVAEAGGEILGAARFTRLRATNSAEFAMVVSDRCQRRGLGQLLLGQLIEVARREGLESLTGDTLPGNRPMIALAKKLGFGAEDDREEGTVKLYLGLLNPADAPSTSGRG